MEAIFGSLSARACTGLSLVLLLSSVAPGVSQEIEAAGGPHPFLLVSKSELMEARGRLGREPWKALLEELKDQAEEDLRVPLPQFETEWWETAKVRPWGEIYPEIAEHTMFVPWKPIAAAHRISTLYLLTGEERLAEHLLKVLRHYSTYTFEFEHYDVGMNYAG